MAILAGEHFLQCHETIFIVVDEKDINFLWFGLGKLPAKRFGSRPVKGEIPFQGHTPSSAKSELYAKPLTVSVGKLPTEA
jgi:hypothetical protein